MKNILLIALVSTITLNVYLFGQPPKLTGSKNFQKPYVPKSTVRFNPGDTLKKRDIRHKNKYIASPVAKIKIDSRPDIGEINTRDIKSSISRTGKELRARVLNNNLLKDKAKRVEQKIKSLKIASEGVSNLPDFGQLLDE